MTDKQHKAPEPIVEATYTQAECDELCEIAERDGYEKAVQEIDQLTGGDGEYRVSMLVGGGVDDERHTPDAASMIQRIVDRFEILNLLDEATKTGSDQPDDAPSPEPIVDGAAREFMGAAEALLDWMNGNELVADQKRQRPKDYERLCATMVALRAALATAAEGK